MCGIAGILHFNGDRADQDQVGRMISLIRYRGPDAAGTYTDGPAGLAHARLSIIDLAGGSQPMHNEDEMVWITFNGEIFNYLELREDLVARGHRFATQSDTEVIVHLYEEYGPECVTRLNGQWAFAIWDKRKRALFLSRDRLGVRPVFYARADGAFLFASEVKALFSHPAVRRELDIRALDEIFTFWCTVPPQTAFKNVFELPPGHSMRVQDGNISTWAHWNPEYPQPGPSPNGAAGSEAHYAEELVQLMIDATRIRLRADVPVGAYLSGGLDSTITTALIKRFTNARLRTFSVTFQDKEFDERPFQQEAVRFFDTEHQDVWCSEDDIAAIFPDVIWHTEKPLVRTAPAPLFLLSRLVRDAGFKVVLTGEGSDEMFGGYDIFKEAKIRRFWLSHPESRLRPALLRKLYPYLANVQSQPDAYLRAFFHVAQGTSNPRFFSHVPRWNLTAKVKSFFSAAVKAELRERNVYASLDAELPREYDRWHWFSQAQYLESRYLLPGYILSSQGDRVAMAHAVEGRYPFLDKRVVDFAAKLPPELKMKVLNEKYLLKRAFGKMIPAAIAARPKQPYRAPEGRCFVSNPARDYVAELLDRRRIEQDGIFEARAVERLVEKFKSNQAIAIKDNMALVGIVSTQLVMDQFVLNFSRRQHGNDRAAVARVHN